MLEESRVATKIQICFKQLYLKQHKNINEIKTKWQMTEKNKKQDTF